MSSKKLNAIKTKQIKKTAKLAKLQKKYKYKAVKPVCLEELQLGSKKRVLRLDKEKGDYLKQALAQKPNMTLPELRTMVKR